MTKIYNEIVIDMNPESPTFEETLYEDSFEYNGDMMLMQDQVIYAIDFVGADGTTYYQKWTNSNGYWTGGGGSLKGENLPSNARIVEDRSFVGKEVTGDYTYESLIAKSTDLEGSGSDIEGDIDEFGKGIYAGGVDISTLDFTGLTEEEAMNLIAEQVYAWKPDSNEEDQEYSIPWSRIKTELYATGYTKFQGDSPIEGLEQMTEEIWSGKSDEEKAEYIFETEFNNQATPEMNTYPGGPMEWIKEQLHLQPVLEQIDEEGEDVQFLEKARGLTTEQAKLAKARDIYNLQGDASTVGAVSGNLAATGMGAGARGAIAGTQALGKGLETAYDQYGLATAGADLTYDVGYYGLEKGFEKDWETNWKDFMSTIGDAG